MPDTPQSFTPRSRRPRPQAGQAHRVGRGDTSPAPGHTQRMSATHVQRLLDKKGSGRSSTERRSIMPTPQRKKAPTAPSSHSPTPTPQRVPTPQRATSYKSRSRTGRKKIKKIPSLITLFLVITLIVWPVYLFTYGNSKLEHIDALSEAPDTPGDTFLIVGSDRRDSSLPDDGTTGQRSDTIMVLQLPEHGHASLVSLPRDTLVDIPGYGANKINAAYSYGGAPLLVQTVENLTGLTVDHYVEVSMNGVNNLVDAVDGVNVCYDADVSDPYSGMEWTAGCHDVNGNQALAFSRMRYADPLGDIGRTQRQRQVVSKVVDKAFSADIILHPMRQRSLVAAGASNLATDNDTSLFGLVQAAVGLRSVMGENGLMGAPPISSMSYWHQGQSCVQLNPDTISDFWGKMREGTLTQNDFNAPQS